jgi:Cu2+-exporting ATPase
LRYASAAARHLADDRASALSDACRDRSLTQLRLEPVADTGGPAGAFGLTVRHGRRRVRIVDLPPNGDPAPPLAVEIDGVTAGVFRFRRARRPEAAGAVARLKAVSGARVVLLSDHPERDAGALAKALGVDAVAAGLNEADKARYLADGRQRGARVAWVGDGRAHPSLVRASHVSFSVSGVADADADVDPSSVLLLTPRLTPLAELWAIAREHDGRLNEARRLTLLPNLLCVAGAFTFGFTSLTSVVISNLGTLGVYTRSARSLRAVRPPGLALSSQPHPSSHETPEPGAPRAKRPA